MNEKLIHPDWEFQIKLEDGNSTILVIENPSNLRKTLVELIAQSKGEDGNFVFSDDKCELSIRDRFSIVTDILNLNPVSKKVSSRIQQMIKEKIVSEEHYVETMELISHIEKYADILESDFWFSLSHEPYDIDSLLKMLNLHLTVDYDNEVERVLEYMNTMHEICGVDCFVYVSLFSLFNSEELKTIVLESSSNKHNIIFLENREPEMMPCDIKKVIIDQDFCQVF